MPKWAEQVFVVITTDGGHYWYADTEAIGAATAAKVDDNFGLICAHCDRELIVLRSSTAPSAMASKMATAHASTKLPTTTDGVTAIV